MLQKWWQEGVVAHRFEIATTFLVLLTGAWFYVLFLKPTFYINRIVVRGQEEIQPDEIEQIVQDHLASRAWLLIPRAHRLFMGLPSLKQEILSHYDLETIRLDPDWTAHVLEVTIHEKPSLFVYAVDNRYYTLDKEGSVIRELPEQPDPSVLSVPVLYEYDEKKAPSVGDHVLTHQCIASIQTLVEGMKAYPQVQIHSFRLRTSPQREITITDAPPTTENSAQSELAKKQSSDLEKAAESIAQAKTIDQKVSQLKDALKSLSIEKLDEGKLDQLLKEQRVYSPTEGYEYKELEIYTQQGWSIKLGHDVFDDAAAAQDDLNIFATLEKSVNLSEVREYVDLRIPNRVYYR